MTDLLLLFVLVLLTAVLAACAFVLYRLGLLDSTMRSDLESMRHTVDERLQKSLESRLGESFSQVARQLEQVQLVQPEE